MTVTVCGGTHSCGIGTLGRRCAPTAAVGLEEESGSVLPSKSKKCGSTLLQLLLHFVIVDVNLFRASVSFPTYNLSYRKTTSVYNYVSVVLKYPSFPLFSLVRRWLDFVFPLLSPSLLSSPSARKCGPWIRYNEISVPQSYRVRPHNAHIIRAHTHHVQAR